jgi:predicted ATP-binding protein involved in virulence
VSRFEQLENQELRRKEEHGGALRGPQPLDAVRQALEQMLPGLCKPRIDAETGRLVVDGENRAGGRLKLWLEQLSDGYQVMLGVVLDFALRLVQANPPTPEFPNPLAAEAIMLLDEVDLHLHPTWQQRVIPDLLRTFPGTQFILTTHSPQVVTTVRKQHLRHLKDFQALEVPTETIGAESSRALADAFEVPSRPQALEEVKLLNRYVALAEHPDANPAEVLGLRQEIRRLFSDDEPMIELVDMTLEQKKLLAVMGLKLPALPAPTNGKH